MTNPIAAALLAIDALRADDLETGSGIISDLIGMPDTSFSVPLTEEQVEALSETSDRDDLIGLLVAIALAET